MEILLQNNQNKTLLHSVFLFLTMSISVREIYNQFERGRTPESDMVVKDDMIESISVTSLRDDIIVGQHFAGDTYNIIKISPNERSQREQIMKNMKNPLKNNLNDRFDGCIYQLGCINIPELDVNSERYSKSILQRMCHNIRPWSTGKKTVKSANQLEKIWLDFNSKK